MAEGERQRFTVELRGGETTIVSWKKLLKDSNSNNNNNNANAVIISNNNDINNNNIPSQSQNPEAPDGPPTSRLSTVIERIERLYVGKASSDEEDLNDVVPDDDEYDTEDSFIDDAELDEYFQVDNSAIKHDGFFVNRGKLERVEPAELPNQPQKKRRRKDLTKDSGRVDLKNQHLQVGKKIRKTATGDGKHPSKNSHVVALPSSRPEDVKAQTQVTAPEISLKKITAEAKSTYEVACSGESNGDGRRQEKETVKQKQAVGSLKNSVGEMSGHRNSHEQGKPSTNVGELDQATQLMDYSSSHEKPTIASPSGNKPGKLARKEGSSSRPRSTMLEKAIKDLEKLVAESRPPVSEVQDGENSLQSVKRRLPPEVKQKIAKVARLAQASHGKITKEVLNRLMSIVGHMIQLRSLKRNLKIMVNMGLSAKQEKDHRVQLIKREVSEMVKARIPLMKSKVQEQLGGISNDLQESKTEETEALRRKYSMDDSLEDKICDLYNLYVEGLEADAGPQVRKLYAELAAFWPTGYMDNHGIKRAICRAKDRRRPLQSRQQSIEKANKKKALVPKAGVKAISPAQPPHTASNQALSCENKLINSNAAASTTSQIPGPNVGISSTDKPKQEKLKGSSSSSGDANRAELISTKKVALKPEIEQSETESSHEKSENLVKEGMIKRQQLTASMLNQLFET